MQLRPKQVREARHSDSPISAKVVLQAAVAAAAVVATCNLFALKIYCYAVWLPLEWPEMGKEATAKAKTIYGIAAIVANCKCCGKQVN